MNYSEKVIPILRQLRPVVLPHWGSAEVIGKKSDSATDVVTEVDVEVEKIASKGLTEIYPDIEFVGEEQGGNRGAKRFWLMDPIDGTGHYIRGLPFCTTMIALIEDGQVNFSAIYDFLNDNMYWAERGKGAFRDNDRLQVSNRTLAQSYIGWEIRRDKKENDEIFSELRKRAVLFKSVSAGWEYAMIAAGKLDARICFDPYGKDYDFSPGSLLVSEAGGVVANLNSDSYDYRNTNFIAANPIIYKELTSGNNPLFPLK